MSDFSTQLTEHTKLDNERFIEISKKLDAIEKKLDPILDVYKAVLLSKSFVTGVAAVIVAIGAIGAGIVWFISSIANRS